MSWGCKVAPVCLPRHRRDRVRPVRGTFKNVIRIAPPLNAAEPQTDAAPAMLERTMTAVA